MAQTNRSHPKYVYDLPYFERMELCRILDQNDKWEELGGIYMSFDVMTIQTLRREILRGNSPTDELLTKWGHQNHTILELFVLLSKMQHYQAMLTIKQFVDPEYHRLIYEGEQNLSRIFKPRQTSSLSAPNNASRQLNLNASAHEKTQAQNVKAEEFVNMDISKSSNNLPDKIAFPVEEESERKILNIDTLGEHDGNENCSNRSNAQTVLMNRVENAMALDPSDLQKPKSSKAESSKDKSISEISSIAESVGILPVITFKELELATNCWDPSTVLGKGGFGTVYKGIWKNTQVAIKRTRNSETDENHTAQIQQILAELKMLNSYRHDNILPLYGFSKGGDDPCLIYQYMPNGSLEDRLLCRQGTKPLSWFQKHNIATGTARGLQFLHTIGEKPLIHGDIKSANILLDSNFEPKIGDFGLAREGPYNHYTHMKVSRVHGTRPYLPDEFLRHKKFSTKVDTHSFGIVLFELATGLRAYDDQRTHKFLKDLIENSPETQLENLVDKKCGPDEQQTFANLIALGKFCVSKKPKDRPEMVQVLQELNAMAVNRDKLVKVQSMIRQNSLTPSNPYEMQALHDHLSQQRRMSPSPSQFRAISPQQQQHQPPMVYPESSRVSPVPPEAEISRNNNPFLPPDNEKIQNKEASSPSHFSNNNDVDVGHPSSAKHWNTGIVPPHILKKINREGDIAPMPSISVSPPSKNHNHSQSKEQQESSPPYKSCQSESDEDYLYLSQCDNNLIPLISVLGVKPKSNDEKARTESRESSEDSLLSEAAGEVDNVSTSAKGKELWILGDTS